ncbi:MULTISPECIES: inositol monophosphatase family protein [Dietzia]|uniref:inositol-phosphate phosphatase n=1 Tax=Dietzia cinnamea TaxID=321318 RepID=A0AAW5QCH4_9ACTN|nr:MULTISPECIES: inositol monophosphatase family protein [Dietzia]PWD96261.1 inositol monophosphatase [Dietzia maris]MBM7230879.1 inositol monophosphatase [Dietzia cinnamea]MCT1865482.1 inositol monophosphatase [Dietzia cinnamea]MCT2031497.1 inositol monophosphatase [Dietzia cinnamea]MCT2034722.1 inositol monophosphatase [Dietzia cinnamea]
MTSSGAAEEAGRTGPEFVDGLRELAERVAVSGGDVARRMLAEFDSRGPGSQGLGSRSKSSETDPVTVIDTSVEEHLRREIAAARPGDTVLGEEGGEGGEVTDEAPGDPPGAPAGGPSGEPAGDPVDGDFAGAREPRVRWVVDPVDGTVNLLYGIPFTAVSVAAEVDGVVVAGAVHNIVTRETWSGGSGRGAALREADGTTTALRVSDCADLSLALVGTGFAYDAGIRAEQGRVVAELLPRVRDIRRCGSAALDLCMLATGRLDAYYERGLKYWDHAAGALIAAEAGAVVAVSEDDAVPTTGATPGVSAEFLSALAGATGRLSS